MKHLAGDANNQRSVSILEPGRDVLLCGSTVNGVTAGVVGCLCDGDVRGAVHVN